MRVRF